MLERGEGPARLEGDRLVVGRDTGDDQPESVKRVKGLLAEVFPLVELTEVLIAMDRATGFSERLLHAAGASSRSPSMLVHLYAAILAQATNLGPVAMARSSGLSYDQVAHATAWYLRHETLTAAIDDVVNYHHHLPATRLWGDGTFASSDGQRFPVQVKAANAGALPRYFGFGRGLSVLTSVTDHYATFGTKVIPASAREGLFALDEIFALRDRDSELAITGHTTDTAGFTDLLFGVYDVVGLGFSPRIRDLADQRLWCLDDTAMPDLVEPLVANRVNVELIAAHWDDLLRLGASIHEGAVLPSLLLTKLQAFPRQNALARALQEHGRLVKTLFILRYLQRPEMRRRVGGQLNKGENLNGLRETVNFAHGGAIRHRQLTDQVAQALCLTLVVNCIAAFNAGLLAPAVEALRTAGFEVDDADVAHVGPTITEHISVHGRYYYDLDRPPKGLRRPGAPPGPQPGRRRPQEPGPGRQEDERGPVRRHRRDRGTGDCLPRRMCDDDSTNRPPATPRSTGVPPVGAVPQGARPASHFHPSGTATMVMPPSSPMYTTSMCHNEGRAITACGTVTAVDYAYARVSTTQQDLDRQLDALAKAASTPNGSTATRSPGPPPTGPDSCDVLDRLREGDVLIVYTLDRLGRTVRDVLNQIHDLREAGIGLRTLADAIPIDTSKPGDAISDLAIVLLSLFAQMERTYAAERAAHARAVREEKGQRTGRKIAANTEQHLEWARHLRDVDHLTMAEITAKTGIPRTSLYRHFNRMDDRTVSAG